MRLRKRPINVKVRESSLWEYQSWDLKEDGNQGGAWRKAWQAGACHWYANSGFSSSEWQSPAQSITLSCRFLWHEERLLSACHTGRSNQAPLPPGVSVFYLKNPDVSATGHPNRSCSLTNNSWSIGESQAALVRGHLTPPTPVLLLGWPLPLRFQLGFHPWRKLGWQRPCFACIVLRIYRPEWNIKMCQELNFGNIFSK